MSLPAPLSHAFPHLVAQIDAERPRIAAALLDVIVTEITADTLRCNVTTQHSYDLLTSHRQYDYLNTVACKHLKVSNAVFIFDNDTPTTAEQDMGELPLPASEHVVHALACPASAPQSPTPQRNALKFNDRSRLSEWMKLPENKDYVEKQTDAESAIRATNALQIAITPANITGMRLTLGIQKFKPAPPEPPPAATDIDLIALQKQLTDQGLKLESTRLEATSTRDLVNQLVAHVRYQQLVILQNATQLTALPESTMTQFKDLQPLAPLPQAPSSL